MNLGVISKGNFFDAKKIVNRVNAGKRKALSKCGAFVRRSAKSSLKYGDKVSPPGSPPTVRRHPGFTQQKKNRKTGQRTAQPSSPFRELMYFAYDERSRSVVIGPALFRNSASGGGLVPMLLEKGGEERQVIKGRKPRTLHIRPHPTMQPALMANVSKFPEQFRGILK